MGVGCGESGIGTGSHFKKRGVMVGGGISQEVARHLRYGLPERTHASELGCAGELPSHELMSIYFNDRPNEFWAKHEAIGYAPLALMGLKPSF